MEVFVFLAPMVICAHPRLCLLGNRSRRYSTSYIPIVVIRSRPSFQTRLYHPHPWQWHSVKEYVPFG